MGSQAEDPATQRRRLMERVTTLQDLLRRTVHWSEAFQRTCRRNAADCAAAADGPAQQYWQDLADRVASDVAAVHAAVGEGAKES